MIDWEKWREPKRFGISGCFRLRNESEFMRAAVLSHLPYLDEAVLVVQPSEDDTVEKAYQMQNEHPDKVMVYEYPYIVDWIDTPGFYSKDPNEPGHLVHMSNFALSLCSYSWIAKTEGDVICLSSFQRIVDAVKAEPEKHHYYGRVVLNMAGLNCNKFSVTVPRNGGWDEAVFNNNPDWYKFKRVSKWEVIPSGPSKSCFGWSGLHMKRCKKVNIGWNGEKYAPFTPEVVTNSLNEYNAHSHYPGSDNPAGEECLFETEWKEYV